MPFSSLMLVRELGLLDRQQLRIMVSVSQGWDHQVLLKYKWKHLPILSPQEVHHKLRSNNNKSLKNLNSNQIRYFSQVWRPTPNSNIKFKCNRI